MSSAWLTIVTVVKDDQRGFARTVESLLTQDMTDVQHVVVDSSIDRDAISDVLAGTDIGSEYFWVSAAGVYAAMNTGLEHAVGEYAYFLNAGDWLYAPSTLAEIRSVVTHTTPIWAFGPVEIHSENSERTITPDWDYRREVAVGLSRGHFPPHQGTVVRTSVLRDLGGFDTSYRITGDYAMVLQLTKVAEPEKFTFLVACFAEGGVSTLEWKRSLREFHRARVSIWQPTGLMAARERFETRKQFLRMWVARDLLGRGKR